jgi:uncharacterized membrane protein
VSTLENTHLRNNLRTISLILVVAGLLITGYISYTAITNTSLVCLEGGALSCDLVHSSVYAKLAGIDISYLGFLAYLGLGALLALEDRLSLLQTYSKTLIFGATLFAFLYAIWLIYVQAVLLEAFCMWCMAHEINITLLFVVSALRLWRELRA